MADVQEPKNALWRREEQLRRWDLSETNKESAAPRSRDVSKIKFQDGCVFLAACSSGDKDEVERLIGRGADINTANIDGLTALHQACIDDNLDMVEFLVERGADIDACDNEGWTPLHATASCGFMEIAKYLIEHGANVAAVNNDGELPIDISEGDDMDEILSDEMEARGVDAEAARMEEEQSMLRDANQLLSCVMNGEELKEVVHPKTGATALHIAAAKGYIKVMNILMQAGAALNTQDFDGWTPLHAAAHWGQEDASRVLVEKICDMDIKNSAGQTAIDVADSDLQLYLEDLKKNQATLKKDRENEEKNVILQRQGVPPLKRSTDKWESVELDLNISDIYNRNDVSSVTRMSGDQREKVGQKNAEEEREIRQKALDEKEEEKRSESSADEASTSDSETEENYVVFVPAEKQNEINRQSSVSKRTEEPVATPSESQTPPQEAPPTVDDKEKAETKPPPLRSLTTPRIQDVAEERQRNAEADKENEHTEQPAKSEVVMRRDVEQLKPKEQNEEVLKEEEGEKDNRLTSTFPNKSVLGRSLSLPATRPPSGVSQAPGFTPKSITTSTTNTTSTTTKAEVDPASWRAGLRKTGSSSAVPDSAVCKDKDFDKLARSASSPWLAPERRQEEIGRKRPVSVSSVLADNQESRNYNREKRFNDFYSRYTSLVNSNKSNALVEPSTTSTTTSGTSPTTSTATTITNSSPSSPLPQQSSYVPLPRRRHTDLDTTTDSERTFSTGTTTTSTLGTSTSTTSPTSTTQLAGQRRSFEPPKRDEERETERKLKARRARESRRSTQGVTKEDLERAEQTLQAATRGTDPPPDLDKSDDKSDKENKPEDTSISTRRRHTWDDKKDDDTRNSSRRARDSTALSDSTSYLRSRPTSSITSSLDTTTSTTTPSYRTTSYRSKYSSQRNEDDTEKEADKEKDKEKEDPSQKSSAIRTRRKRENRRPTGKINPEDVIQGVRKDDSDDKKDEKKEEDRTSSRYTTTRYSEPTSVYDRTSYSSSRADRPTSYSSSYRSYPSSLDKDIDYKKLYEEEKLENERLRKDVKRLQQDISELKLDLEKAKQKNESRSYESSTDKRERRALERKLSELEEELKERENLKADNARLKEENGALIRVISKLSK